MFLEFEVTPVALYAKTPCKKGRTCLKYSKEIYLFLFNFDVVYEKIDHRGVSKVTLHVSPHKTSYIYQGQSLENYEVLVFMYSLGEIGLFKIAKLQNCTKGSFKQLRGTNFTQSRPPTHPLALELKMWTF